MARHAIRLRELTDEKKMNKDTYNKLIQAARKIDGAYADGYCAGLARSTTKHDAENPPAHDESPEFFEGYKDGLAQVPPRGAHGNLLNTNASKDKTLTSQVVFRCHREDKARWVKEARNEGKKLGKWIIDKLNN